MLRQRFNFTAYFSAAHDSKAQMRQSEHFWVQKSELTLKCAQMHLILPPARLLKCENWGQKVHEAYQAIKRCADVLLSHGFPLMPHATGLYLLLSQS